MSFLTEILAVAVVWLSSFALCQFGVAVEARARPEAKTAHVKTVARSPRDVSARSAPLPIPAASEAARLARRGA